ncbi:hypothetical protein I4U23_004703 [Adineta vaga]|nr:hypothetical protein I4U23_004703 [Adineta vaga]
MIFVGVIFFLLINSSMTINGDEYEDDDYIENRISFSELSSMISNVKIENDQCEFQLTQNLFFHFPSSSSTTIGTINGPTIFSIDFNVQTYIVSIKCPFKYTCMWLFDGRVICPRSDTRVNLTFDQTLIGNRTLSYVKYISNKPIILASLVILILPKTIPAPTCNDSIRNQDETDIDCGGSTCKKCDLNQTCQVNRDCSNGYCPSTMKICQCSNGIYWNAIGTIYAGTGELGSELNQLHLPYGIAFDSNNNLFITDDGNNRVVKYSPGASGVYSLKSSFSSIREFMASGQNNGTLVAAGQTNVSGSNLNQFFKGLGYLYVDSNQTLYIADYDNHRVIHWERNASNGTIVAGNGTVGSTLEQVNSPYGIWVDSNSNVFVSEENNNHVTLWSPGAPGGVLVAGAADYTPGTETHVDIM